MQTPNTLHKQLCSEPGCVNDAVITKADGRFRLAPKGACIEHLACLKTATERRIEEENQILKDLGFMQAA